VHAHVCEVGYWLGRAYWGRGVATAALKQFIPYAFETVRGAAATSPSRAVGAAATSPSRAVARVIYQRFIGHVRPARRQGCVEAQRALLCAHLPLPSPPPH
jgi:hypothetical protein